MTFELSPPTSLTPENKFHLSVTLPHREAVYIMFSAENLKQSFLPPHLFPSRPFKQPTLISTPVTNSARCLMQVPGGPDLSCSRWIKKNNQSARGAFFARGSGSTLNALSSRSIMESCTATTDSPSYMVQSQILNTSLLKKLESFQAELAKRDPSTPYKSTLLLHLNVYFQLSNVST